MKWKSVCDFLRYISSRISIDILFQKKEENREFKDLPDKQMRTKKAYPFFMHHLTLKE